MMEQQNAGKIFVGTQEEFDAIKPQPTDEPVLCRFVIRPCKFPEARYDVVGNVCHMCSLNYIGKTIHDLQQFLR